MDEVDRRQYTTSGGRRRRSSVTFQEDCLKLQAEEDSKQNLIGHKKQSSPTPPNGLSSNLRSLVTTISNFPNDDSQKANKNSATASKEKSIPRKRANSIFARASTNISDVDDERTSHKNSAVWCLRVMTILVLAIAAITVSALTFSYAHAAEVEQFEEIYYDSIIKVEEAIATAINNKLKTAETFSALYTSRYHDNIWPNVTMPMHEFNAQAAGQLEIAGGVALSFNPIIDGNNRDEFEAHAEESASILGANELVLRSCDDTSGSTCRVVADGIFRKAPSPSGDGSLININDTGFSEGSRYPYTMVPVWQIFPADVNWRAVMFNLHSETARQHALDDMLEYEVPTFTALLHLVQHTEMNPSSILFYPVFNRFKDVGYNDFDQPLRRKIVGSVSIVFTWEDMLRKVLPGYINGMIVVLESIVSDTVPKQLWTYDVSGEVVTLLGEGDLHDPQFDEYQHSVQANVAKEAIDLGIVDYLITYRLRIYPSTEFRNGYLSHKPEIMTAVVMCVFVLTSMMFGAYDYLIRFRLKAIISFATRSGQIVDSMFPASVRERLFSHTEDINKQLNAEADDECASHCDDVNRMRKFEKIKSFMINAMGRKDSQVRHGYQMRGGSSSGGESVNSTSTIILNTPPIAEYFHETSIMFADIVGFTEWCSNHNPEEVFHLLESLYFEFDRLAVRMNVFKLGTIGDCYGKVADISICLCIHFLFLMLTT